jgi:hypothetical protein
LQCEEEIDWLHTVLPWPWGQRPKPLVWGWGAVLRRSLKSVIAAAACRARNPRLLPAGRGNQAFFHDAPHSLFREPNPVPPHYLDSAGAMTWASSNREIDFNLGAITGQEY